MPRTVAVSGLAVYDFAVEAAGIALELAVKVPAPLKPIADQLIRSAKEVDSHLQLLVAAGAVNRVRAENALKTFDRVRAMTWRLLNPSH